MMPWGDFDDDELCEACECQWWDGLPCKRCGEPVCVSCEWCPECGMRGAFRG